MKRQSIFSKIFLVLSLIGTLAMQTTAFAAELTGEAQISGDAVYGQTLTASRVGGDPITGTLLYQWFRDSDMITENGNAATYTLVLADIGTQISVVITSNNVSETGELTSAPTDTVVKAPSDPATGDPPVVFYQNRRIHYSDGCNRL